MTIDDLSNEITNRQCAFLCGNGFSMNFDSGFSNIHSRLYEVHKSLYKNTKYKVKSRNEVLICKLMAPEGGLFSRIKQSANKMNAKAKCE